ncbi:MAG: hypothetical protein HWE16_15895, partial [Gammaproteobacteria bacterium]|nr:hypothetical protein [Gammaproteobacteria bacterium]
MLKKDKSKLAVLVSASLAASVAMTTASASPFAVNDLAQGYNLAQFDGEGKCGEGKCGEAKKDGKEGKCGEGKCGEAK